MDHLDDYVGPGRRTHISTLTEVEEIFRRLLLEHEQREQASVIQTINELKKEAFPDGAENHRNAHQAMIDAAKAQEEFYRGLKNRFLERSIFGVLQVLFMLAAVGLIGTLAGKLGLGSAFTAWISK